MPDVTVLMTVYNGMPYLPLAVESVLTQTLRDFRFVIVNDGATDRTADYLDRLIDPRVCVLHQSNRGTAAAANFGLAHCETEFVARMDSDDVSLPTRLTRQVAYLRANSDVGLVGAQVAPLGSVRAGRSLHLPHEHDAIYAALSTGRHALAHSSIMFRTALLHQQGGYWSLPLVDDWDMILRMGEAARLANLPEVLHHYRVHAGSLNGSAMRRMRFSIDYACELARRRRASLPLISPAEFRVQRNARPWRKQVADRLQCYALEHYRLAVAEHCGGRPVRSRLRLAWAAACAPQLTWQRMIRMFRRSPDSTSSETNGRNLERWSEAAVQ